MNCFYYRLCWFASILALIVIVLGAYTRLKDAGLGCPDWPGCYGQLTVPQTAPDLAKANAQFPGQVVEAEKAWLEMIHRYFAGGLGLIIFGLTIWSLVRRVKNSAQPILIPILLSGLVVFQAALGMWTVTLSLLPLVVTGHLLGGVLIVSLLWMLTLSSIESFRSTSAYLHYPKLKIAAIFGFLIVFIQIFLGGWVSSNYAALICPSFPSCYGQLFPSFLTLVNIQEAFNFFALVGVNYEGGVLNQEVRGVIQMFHRYAGLIVLLYIGSIGIYLVAACKEAILKKIGWVMLVLLLIQIVLGMLNIYLMLPIGIAVLHNFVAVLLCLSTVTLLYQLFCKPSNKKAS